MNPNCVTEVVTPTGKFTFHDQQLSVCEAKKICASKGEILAPITNRADFEALYRVTQMGNHPSCPFHYGFEFMYSIGLDVTPCGKGKQDRVFTNGVVWNNTVHGKLYSDYSDSWNSPCVYAYLDTSASRPTVATYIPYCHQSNLLRFICLKEAAPSKVVGACGSCGSAGALSIGGNLNGGLAGMVVVACFSLVAIFFAVMAIMYYRKYQTVEEKHNNLLKS